MITTALFRAPMRSMSMISTESLEYTKVVDRYRSGESILSIAPKYDYSVLFPGEPGPVRWATTLHNIIGNNTLRRNFIMTLPRTPYPLIQAHHPVAEQVIDEFSEKCPGADVKWAFETVSIVERNGWEAFAGHRIREIESYFRVRGK